MSFLRLAPRLALRANTVAIPRAALVMPRFNLTQKQPVLRATYASSAGLSKADITTRIFEVLRGFEGISPEKITEKAAFDTDLGLDSLDAVEVVMAVEEEFGIEIPDAEADEIKTVEQAINYIASTPDAS
ncbi:acyl carrier protein-like protein [Flagelloscypha sp. PMI_526]|nr:acyl carrier protein-like protein [Flagelloscypha sp. PMI_526]